MNVKRIGTITRVVVSFYRRRIQVVCTIASGKVSKIIRILDPVQVDAILPRSVLLGESLTIPYDLLPTLQAIVARMTEGRKVVFSDNSIACRFQGWSHCKEAKA